MSCHNFVDNQRCNPGCLRRRKSECLSPTCLVVWENDDVSITTGGNRKWTKNVHGNAIEGTLYWNREQWCFTFMSWNLLHGTVNARFAPVLYILEDSMPIKTSSSLFLGLENAKMCCRWIIMKGSKNFMPKRYGNDNLRT